MARPHRGWAAVRVLAVPALLIAGIAWFSFPRIARALPFDRAFATTLDLLLVVGGFELLVLAAFLFDRRKVTLSGSGLTLAGAAGLLPRRTIALSSIAAIGVEGATATPSILRLTARGRGITSEDAAIGLGNDERTIQAVQNHFRMLGVDVRERGPAPAPPLRNQVLGRVIIYGLIASNFFDLPQISDSSGDAVRTPAAPDLDPSIRCVAAKPGGLISVDVANVERLVDVKIQSHTIGLRDIRTERIGPSLTRLTVRDPPADGTISDEAEPRETLTVFSRSPDGTTHSGWTSFNPKDHRVQGYQCP